MNHLRARRLPALAVAAALTAVCLAACGSSSSSTSTSSSAAAASSTASRGSGFDRTKLTACLKAHGVTLPTRPPGAGTGGGAGGAPPAGGGGAGSGQGRRGLFGGGGAGAGGFANNPKLRAAFQACGGGRSFGARRFTPNHAAVTKFVACVKQHGYNLPAPNFSGKGPIFPAKIEANKTFQTASRACASDLRPAAGGPGTAGPGSSGSSTTTGD